MSTIRHDLEAREDQFLAPNAARSARSRGRVREEPQDPIRPAFQRDRDRVIHSKAFRRLKHKTQVFFSPTGDHYRTRLTHTLEVSQIARSIAKVLRLHEELTEAIALGHDLGHPPFGHAGERVLNRLMHDDGGFDHNRQSLRVVDLLEERYAGFRGLNLSYETREGILKHPATWDHPVPRPDRSGQTPLEAQVADRSDEIAYTNHDLDDGLRSALLTLDQLGEVPLWREVCAETRDRMPDAPTPVLRAQTIVALLNRLVTDLLEATAQRLDTARPADVDAVRAAPLRWLDYSPALAKGLRALKEFLYRNLYYHPHVVATTEKAERVLEELWRVYRSEPATVPAQVRAHFAADGEARAIADYVAGMTDRFALAEHRRLTHGRGLD